MRTSSGKCLLFIVTLACVSVMTAKPQTFTTLYCFTAGQGGEMLGGLISSGNRLYGATLGGGSGNWGTVFSVDADGSDYRILYSFVKDSDGYNPFCRLILLSNCLYGTTFAGGALGGGTVFKLNIDGTGFTNLHSFNSLDNSEGVHPHSGLSLAGGTLYGTAYNGGSSLDGGTVYRLNTDGTSFAVLHAFSGSDGRGPYSAVLISSNVLYGTTQYGGTKGAGVVFKVGADGTGFTVLHSFVNNDGNLPTGGLILNGNTLYGSTSGGGVNGNSGTLFAIRTDGSNFSSLHSMQPSEGSPDSTLVLVGNTLYGAASWGGPSNKGTVFAINADGTGYTVLHVFSGGSDGAHPYAGLLLSSNTLYGNSAIGGNSSFGTLFSVSLGAPTPPQLIIGSSEGNVILSWPADMLGLGLQATTDLVARAVWTPVSPAPVVVDGRYTLTNPLSSTQRFFRLSQ